MILSVLKFMLGACLGSFIYCFIQQCLAYETTIWRRSRCAHCKHSLHWFDLIPIIAAVCLRGRCRYCRQPFSPIHWWAELVVGVLWIICSPLGAVIATLLLAMAYCDWHAYWVPDTLQLLLLGVCLYDVIWMHPNGTAIIFASGMLFLWLIVYPFYSRYIGGADIKLFVTLSLIIPPTQFPLLLLGAGTFGLIHFGWLTIIHQQRPKAIPFIPSIVLSVACCQIYQFLTH